MRRPPKAGGKVEMLHIIPPGKVGCDARGFPQSMAALGRGLDLYTTGWLAAVNGETARGHLSFFRPCRAAVGPCGGSSRLTTQTVPLLGFIKKQLAIERQNPKF